MFAKISRWKQKEKLKLVWYFITIIIRFIFTPFPFFFLPHEIINFYSIQCPRFTLYKLKR